MDPIPETDHQPAPYAAYSGPPPSSERVIMQEQSGLHYDDPGPQVPAYFAEQGYTHDPTAPQQHLDYHELQQENNFVPAQGQDQVYSEDYSGYYDQAAQPQYDEYGNPIQMDPNAQQYDPNQYPQQAYDQEGYPEQGGAHDPYPPGAGVPPGGYMPPPARPNQGGGIIRGFDDPFAGLPEEERQRRAAAQAQGFGHDQAYVTPLPVSGTPPPNYGPPGYQSGTPALPSGEYPTGNVGYQRPSGPPPPRMDYGSPGYVPPPPPADLAGAASYTPPASNFPPPPTSQLGRGGSPFESPKETAARAPAPVSAAATTPPAEGISTAPIVSSAPGFQQLSISHLKKGDDGVGFKLPEAEEDKLDDLEGSMVPLSKEVLTGPARSPAQTSTLYTGSLGASGKGDRAVDESGKPRFVPEIPVPTDDESAPALRLAGISWILFAGIFVLAFALIGKLNLGGQILTPALGTGLFLLMGKRWIGWLALLMGLAYGAFFSWAGYDLQYGQYLRAIDGFNVLKQPVAIGLMSVGFAFLAANMIMLIGRPGMIRSAIGGAFLVLSAPAFLVLMALKGPAANPLSSPNSGWAEERVGSDAEGFFVTKPEGWGRFDWPRVQRQLKFTGNLTTEPSYHFVNRKANLVVGAYSAEIPATTAMAASLLRALPVPDVETEVVRDLKTNGESNSYDFANHRFEQTIYAGKLRSGVSTITIVDKTRIGDRIFLFVTLRDANGSATQAEAEKALNDFRKGLEFVAEETK